jgi:hypothetical protein
MTATQSAIENPLDKQEIDSPANFYIGEADKFVDRFIAQPDTKEEDSFHQGFTALVIELKTHFNYMPKNKISDLQTTYVSDNKNVICIVSAIPSQDEKKPGKKPVSLLFADLYENQQFIVTNDENNYCISKKHGHIEDSGLKKVIHDLSL